jgi:hypothetical protein
VCNNNTDDDGDGLVDCADPDCLVPNVETCNDMCMLVPPCLPLRNDPALISFGASEERSTDRPGTFAFHARLHPSTLVDPPADGFIVTLSNANGEIYHAEVKAVDIETAGSRWRYRADDLETVAREGGIAKLSIRRRLYGGEVAYSFRVKAFGDLSRATLPLMTTQVYLGNDVGYVTATWTGEAGHWVLTPKDYDDGVP